QKPKAATGRNSFPPLVLRCSSGLSSRDPRGAEKSIQQDGTFWDGEFAVPIAPLYRVSTSGGNGAGVLRTTDPKAKGHATRRNSFLRWSSAAPAVSLTALLGPFATIKGARK